MRPFRLGRWGPPILPLGTRPPRAAQCFRYPDHSIQWRSLSISSARQESAEQTIKKKRGRPRKSQALEPDVASTPVRSRKPRATTPLADEALVSEEPGEELDNHASSERVNLPSPPPHLATSSAKLAALHARLALPKRFPLQTLSRTLIDATADPNSSFNNNSLALLGNDLLGYYMAEHLLAIYPRLPLPVLYAAQYAYVGPASLASVAQSWGLETAAAPGGEVDPGLLQFQRAAPGTDIETIDKSTRPQDRNRRGDKVSWRRGQASRLVYDDMFGDLQAHADADAPTVTSLERAATRFVRAVAGALYMHAGAAEVKAFFRAHVLSKRLDLASLFTFEHPTRDLSRLCAREGFAAPTARLDSETGRLSAHPVFVVGVYSGADRLGQGAGGSMNEARFRAAVNALKGWYLYSPAAASGRAPLLPSELEGEAGRARDKDWRPLHVDFGEIIV